VSGVAVIRHLLSTNASLTAQVPAGRIIAGIIPQKTALPAIGVTEISGVEHLTVSMAESSRFRTDRVQVTVHASSYSSKKAILLLVRAACANRSGTVNFVKVDSILPAGDGPDLDDDVAVIFEQSSDFIVKWST
jgi:hypothetical protein